jgi:hypothetical protein
LGKIILKIRIKKKLPILAKFKTLKDPSVLMKETNGFVNGHLGLGFRV